MSSKIIGRGALSKRLGPLRDNGRSIVFTNGCFDILHAGHVDYLARAKRLGDILVIGLNSDSSVRKIKGPGRPINSQKGRAMVLAALAAVDYVTVFAESTPEKLIRMLKPDIIAKGGDWKPKDIVGGDFVKSRGGKVVAIPFVKGYSTTAMIKRFK